MIKKITTAWILAIVISILVFAFVWAGTVLDMGMLEDTPPAGAANWTAWRTEGVPIGGGPPNEVMTEDNTGLTQDLGYSDWDGDLIPDWAIQVDNFYTKADGNEINMIFGGLGTTWSGTLWEYSFIWDGINDSVTTHGSTPKSTKVGACPVISNLSFDGSTRTIQFSGEPNTVYYLYRSQNRACDTCEYSNGKYLYLKQTSTDSLGAGSFSDNTTLESWYIVIKAGDSTSALGGCHSEEAFPTAVTVSGFEAAYLPETPAIQLTWETASEVDLMSFRVLRSASVSGDKVALAQLAVQNPGSLVGGSYAYQDENVLFGQTYFYWLEMIHLDGSRDLLGPLQQTVGYLVYLPLSWR